MNRIAVIFSLLSLPLILFGQTTTGGGAYSADATALDWQNNASWTSAIYPGSGTDGDGTLNLDGENLNFNHYMVLGSSTSAVDISIASSNNAGIFSVGDVLIIYGDVSFANKAMPLTISGTLIIVGNLTVSNQLNMTSNGTLVVNGIFDVNNGNQANYSGSGNVYAGSYAGDAQSTIDTGAGDGDSSFTIDELNDPTNGITGDLDFATEIEDFLGGDGGTPLPIKLGSFSAHQEKNSVILDWQTVSEDNFSHFELYRVNEDGKTLFAEIPSTLNSNGDQYYLVDETPALGLNIYQIQSVDFDGYREWFEPISLVFQPEGVSFQLYPNSGKPVELVTDIYEDFTMQVYNLAGRKILETTVQGKDLSDLRGLEKGSYIFRYNINGHLDTQRMIIR